MFWDAEVTRQAIYLAFGVDAEDAHKADAWLRKADRLESQARQAQYQATTALQRMTELTRRMDSLIPIDDEIFERYGDLVEAADKAYRRLDDAHRATEDARLAYSLMAAEHHSLVRDYEKVFGEQFRPGADPKAHPLIQMLLQSHHCQLCGAHSPDVETPVIAALEDGHCPLCRSELGSGVRAADFDELERLDSEIEDARKRLQSAAADASRTEADMKVAEVAYREAFEAKRNFESSHQSIAVSPSSDAPALSSVIRQLEAERQGAQERRDRYREQRDDYRRLLVPVQENAAGKYQSAAPYFVPRFQQLAHAFLGLDLAIEMELRARGAELLLTINGTRRRRTTQLSESQRYFVDIALRMALVDYMVGGGATPGILLIDTPEGSLDVAYEQRAGRLFGEFAASGHQLIMTANINSSNLLVSLAESTGGEVMRIQRMTDWSPLSQVQADAEELFNRAFAGLEDALARGSHE